MQCRCGASSESREAVLGIHTLEYEACRACGMVGAERLLLMGSMIETGLAARQVFQRLKEKKHGSRTE